MCRRRVSNPLALAVLGCLSERPMHPYEISHDAAHPWQGAEHQAQLRVALRGGRVAAEARSDQGAGDDQGGQAPRAHRLRDHRGRQSRSSRTGSAELLSTPVRDFTSLEAGLSLMPGLPPDEVARLLGERAERLRIELRSLDAMFAETAEMRPPRALRDREPVSPAHARRRAGLRLDARGGHPDDQLRRAPRPGDACTNCGPRECHWRRSSPIRWPTWERRRERWHPTDRRLDGARQNPCPVRQHRTGARTPERSRVRPIPRRTPTIGARGSAPPHRRESPHVRTPDTPARRRPASRPTATGRGRPPVRALDGLSVEIEPRAASSRCSAPMGRASPPPSGS